VKVAGAAKKMPRKPARLARDAERLAAVGRLAPGGWFRTTLLARRVDAPRLYLDQWMRETAAIGVGDRVRVTLRRDEASRQLSLPAAFRDALERNKKARAAWDALAPSRRKEILTYLNFLKSPAALERNVAKTIAELAKPGKA
jgi:hypothetical protein